MIGKTLILIAGVCVLGCGAKKDKVFYGYIHEKQEMEDAIRMGGNYNIGHKEKKMTRIEIDRDVSLDDFLGEAGWSIEEDDKRSRYTEIAVRYILLSIEKEEGEITPKQRLEELKKTGNIILDVCILKALLDNQQKINKSWKSYESVMFGTKLKNPQGEICYLGVAWDEQGNEWSLRKYAEDEKINRKQNPCAILITF